MDNKCPQCGGTLENGICPYCGYDAGKSGTPKESAGNNQNAARGSVQGETVTVVNVRNVSGKSKVTALILCILLGEFGVHRFYVGKIGTGLLWLFTLGLFGIGWLVDVVSILLGHFTDSSGLPLDE